MAGVVSDAENAIQRLNASAQSTLTPLARLLLRTESIASSKIEGLQMDVRGLARAEAKSETRHKVGSTAQEIIANIDAMQVAIGDATTTAVFTVEQIIAIHARLMAHAFNTKRIAGKIRDQQNWIGGNDYNPCDADFVPPPPEYVEGLLHDLCEAINDETLPPLVQAAVVHAQFETIHPFEDGNGRTGRALIQVVLRRRRLALDYVPPISVVLAKAKNRYIDGLTAFRADRIEEWVEQFAIAAASAATLAEQYVQRVLELAASCRSALSATTAPRADATAWAIINALPGYPVITAPKIAELVQRSKPSIYDAIQQLADAGVLIPLSQSTRNQTWEAAGLLDLIGQLETGTPPSNRLSPP